MTNPPGAMPPLPEPDGFLTIKIIGRDVEVNAYRDSTMRDYTDACAQAYAAPLLARVAELQAALNELYVTCPTSLECKDFHHSKSERHSGDQPCKPAADFLSALTKARTALSAKD